MSDQPRYKRVLVKLSGESFCAPGASGIDPAAVAAVVEEIRPVVQMGVQVAVVVGGGNIVRSRDLAAGESPSPHLHRTTGDFMGMLATVINALMLRDELEGRGLAARVLSAIPMTGICEPFVRRRAIHHLETERVLILAGGTGNPFFTTDTCAALRANELGAEALLKATKVDGVFDSDPATHPDAKKYERLTYSKVLADRLGVMDLTAISMCMENRIPIVVFQFDKPGNLAGVVRGRAIGTTVVE